MKKFIFYFFLALGALMTFFGALAKVQHWEYGNSLFLGGFAVESVTVFLFALRKLSLKK
jgi:hypothetical protein